MKNIFVNFANFSVRAFQWVLNIVTIDPEKSRDCSFKTPGILADVKSRDPGIPLGPADDIAFSKNVSTMTETFSVLTTPPPNPINLPPNKTETVPGKNDASFGSKITATADNGTITWNEKVFEIMGVEGITGDID